MLVYTGPLLQLEDAAPRIRSHLQSSTPMPRLRHRITVACLLLAAGILAGVLWGVRGPAPSLLDQLTRETRDHGVSGMRVSIISSFRDCAAPTTKDTAAYICPGNVGVPSRSTLALLRTLTRAARAEADPDAMHAAGLALMVFAAGSGNHLDMAISYLQSASRISERPGRVLSDLAAAHLMRAGATGSAWELYQALEAADRALEHEPANPAARFNAAVALEAMHLTGQAREAWAAYLEVDSTSDWVYEAQRRLRLAAPRLPHATPGRTASPAELEAFVAVAPSRARELGWDDLLREWGVAVLNGDTKAAESRLRQSDVLGAALVRRGGDATLADAVDAIRRERADGVALRRLARLHVELAVGRKGMLVNDYEAACPHFTPVARGAAPAALAEWAQVFMGYCALYQRSAAPIDLAELVARSNGVRYPAVAGRKWYALASLRYGEGRFEEALDAFGKAASLYTRAGEADYAAMARMQTGNVRLMMGQRDAGYGVVHESLAVLREHPGSLGLWNGLYALRNALHADGLSRAAMDVQDEAVAVTVWMHPAQQAETLLARARLHRAAGKRDVRGDMVAAMKIMETVDEEYVSRWLHADLRLTRAEAWLSANPRSALPELDSVVSFFANNAPRRASALFARAQAWLALGMVEEAGNDLRRVTSMLDSQRVHVNSAPMRASLLEQSRRIFDQAVTLSVQAGRIGEALDYVERSRASFSPVGRAADWASRSLRAPRGGVAVEFALVGDSLLAWTLWNGGLRLTIRPIRRTDLVRRAERLRAALELASPEGVVLSGLEAMYDELIRPLRRDLGPSGTPLTIIADGELAGLPIAALRDRESGRYLIEDHPLRFASSLRDPAVPAHILEGTPVTLISDPEFDPRDFPDLHRLRGAAAEVASIRGSYRNVRVLAERNADLAAIRAAFLRGGIAHFAGHAVFDDARPERSFLVVADSDAGGAGRLTAGDIERMDLVNLRLVVLSACQTARAQQGRSGGFAGLAGAFLAAGAGGVVGSLWRVDDQATRVLMERFHGAYRSSGDAAQALRQAQLQMLRSRDVALRSPAAWAGFRYAGG